MRKEQEEGQRLRVQGTPTFFINGRRYEGAWDESALTEALTSTPGHRLETASRDFTRWAPATGLLLLVATLTALVVSNTALGEAFSAFWSSV